MVYRVGYHLVYLGEVPFALGTFSDGAIYERAAGDVLDHFPLGAEPFYLQGIYAYVLAIPMLIKPWISLGLILQLALAGFGLWLFHRTMKSLWGPPIGALSTIALMGYAGLAFYENKYLTASIGVTADIAMLAALVWAARGPPRRVLVVGVASGLAFLARPNMLLAVPFAVYACTLLRPSDHQRWVKSVLSFGLGFALAVGPMAARNLAVTGHADVIPIHGGGTSFYIGNNPHARGVWNDAGGMVSARVQHESAELSRELTVRAKTKREGVRAIGDELYDRAWAWIGAHPGDWLVLEARKLWLTVGNEELTQDYDWYGERELLPYAHRIAVPFAVLLGLAVLGFAGRRRIVEPRYEQLNVSQRRAVAWLVLGQVVAISVAVLVFFTSSQHRLPFCVPLAVYAGPGVWVVWRAIQSKRRKGGPIPVPAPVWALAALLALQGFWPRTGRDSPHPVHYYNLGVVVAELGDPVEGLAWIERAVELRPEHPIFRLKRGSLRHTLGDYTGATTDFEWILDQEQLPLKVRETARMEWFSIRHARKQGERRAEGS